MGKCGGRGGGVRLETFFSMPATLFAFSSPLCDIGCDIFPHYDISPTSPGTHGGLKSYIHLGRESRAPPSQVDLVENKRVITSGNTCIEIIISHGNHSAQSVMSHCEEIRASSLLNVQEAKGAGQQAHVLANTRRGRRRHPRCQDRRGGTSELI